MSLPFRYLPEGLHDMDADADVVARWCADTPHWREESITMFGRTIRVPRMVAWYGDSGTCYRYSGVDHVADGWPALLGALRDELTPITGMRCNFVLLNRYSNGRDWMGWHRDDENSVGGRIASVSLGATRAFRLEEGDERFRLDLEHGSILVFEGGLRHTLPRTQKPVGERFNLTFRCIDSPSQRANA